MNDLKKALSFVALLLSCTVIAQQKTIQQVKFAKLKTTKILPVFKFKGKVLTPIVNVNTGAVSADRRTVRDRLVKEVLPFDGTNGAAETEGNETASNGCKSIPTTLKAGFSELNIIDPNGIEIWPGRIVKISSMDDGTYNNFTNFTARKDLNIGLISAGTSKTPVDRTIPAATVTQSTVTNAANNIKNSFGANDFGSISWEFDYTKCYSSEQFFIEAGAGISFSPISLLANGTGLVRNGKKSNTLVIRYMRKAYDVKVENDLAEVVEGTDLGVDAGIIANVSYGQFGIVEIQSDSSYSDMEAAFNFTVNPDPTMSISTDLRTKYQTIASSFKIQGIFRGIQGNSSTDNISSVNDIKRILTGSGAITATTPVVPIAFIVKSLNDGATMMLRSTLSYNKIECPPIVPNAEIVKLKIKLVALTSPRVNDGFSDDEDIFGNIKIKATGVDEIVAWTKTKANNVKIKKSTLPTEDGTYSMAGVARDFYVECERTPAKMMAKKVEVSVNLTDEEGIGGDREYEAKKLSVSFQDLLSSITATSTTTGIDNLDVSNQTFFIDVVENGNTNKVRVWFKAQKVN